MFYVPETNCGASDRVKNLIKKYGGICTDFHECCTTQIKPNVDLQFDSFFTGDIYSESYIYDSIMANKTLVLNDYSVGTVPPTQG